ncbi:MAG TPA: low molecular weight protein-tyrosine-phosphatase [Paraburkholderia sp.]
MIVVCHANVCRSPMAQALLAQRLPGCGIASAGIAAIVGRPADPTACEAIRAFGLDITGHRARRLDDRLCGEASLVLVMERAQRRHIEQQFPFTRGRVFNLGLRIDAAGSPVHFDIADPFRGTRADFDACAAITADAIEAWAERIETLVYPATR